MAKIRGAFCERKVERKEAFDPRSFRWKQRGSAWVLVGCPRGNWRPRRKRGNQCAVGLRAYAILARPKKGRCANGRKVAK
jgi:hypothetical protein